ncbi:MAG TPA: hypothetical protein VKR28_07980, partial [Candidatus Binatus sp.]|nr:hypothetical protein [Candidatus Binatus sp.]
MNDAQMNSSPEPAPPSRQSPTHASLARPKCWLIGNNSELPTAAARVARLRGLEVEIGLPDEAAIRTPAAARDHLIAINFDLLAQLDPGMRSRLRECAESGATIYVRGALQPGRRFPLAPFSDQQFEFVNGPADGYQFSTHPLLPSAIAGERITTQLNMPLAAGLDDGVRPIVSSLHRSGSGTPSIFSIEVGVGLAIFDLNPDDQYDERELLSELAAPTRRASSTGALAAVDWAAGRNPATPVPINLVIDDRPINYDYFNARTLQAFMQHLDDQCPGVHTDFAWTPTHTHPHREYLNVLGRHNAGFVWHGFLRHVDHRTITDYQSQLEAGRARVDEITRKYGVRFQPVMIFPYEKDTPVASNLLRRAGFIAKVESMGGNPPAKYYRLRAIDDESSSDDEFSVIYRDSIDLLNRDRMLALATLGMPVIALAHPRDLSLRRFQRGDRSAMSYFDSVLT